MHRAKFLRRWIWSLAGLLASLTSTHAAASGGDCSFEQPPAQRALGCQQRLARSINFGNMLDHAREGLAGPMLRDEFITLTAQAGFTAIRLPVPKASALLIRDGKGHRASVSAAPSA